MKNINENEVIKGLEDLVLDRKSFIDNKEETDNIFVKDKEILEEAIELLKRKNERINKTLEIAFQYGQIDGAHHKTWVIDQMVRSLTGEQYKEWVRKYKYDEETGDYYSWDKGIAP